MRKIIFFLLVLAMAGCGFRPMYSDNIADIYVAPVSGVNGIELRNALNAQFGGQKDATAPYVLKVNLMGPSTKYKALNPTGDATWQEISMRATYTLTHNGKQIASGTEVASESYTFVRYLVAANASYNNAVKNTINVLGNKIGARAIAETRRYETDADNDK
ncbi:MAG: hypothetical protein IJ560_01550 [Alphaproteobacteria bacterium]|nr:hypothetical protein [Alphaproteobacteria bacterium]